MQAISITQLSRDIEKYLGEVSKNSEPILVSAASEEKTVVIISLKEYNALNETGHLLSTAKNRQRLQDSVEQLKNGTTHKFNL